MVCGRGIRGRARIATVLRTSSFWNVGCASRRNIAGMIENPGDLVQTGGETRAYPSSVRSSQKNIGKVRAWRSNPNAKAGKITDMASNPAHDETS